MQLDVYLSLPFFEEIMGISEWKRRLLKKFGGSYMVGSLVPWFALGGGGVSRVIICINLVKMFSAMNLGQVWLFV